MTLGISVLVRCGLIEWMGPVGEEPEVADVEVIDASGTVVVPGMVDCHSHLTLPGGARWIERCFDSTDALLAAAEDNAHLLRRAGVFWTRDMGSPTRTDPDSGDERPLGLVIRDRWAGHRGYPYVRAAGTWAVRRRGLPAGLGVEVDDADALLTAALGQLDAGADWVKLYLDGPDRETPPFTADEIGKVVRAVRERGARVAAHSTALPGARVAAEAAVDSLEHAWDLDEDTARLMRANGVWLVSTLAVLESLDSFATTTTLPRFTEPSGRAALETRRERARESTQLAARAGVQLAAGTDFGGGSLRANQMAWEVQALVDCGLEPWRALAAATRDGGRLLNEPDAGVLRPGGPADFFLVHGNPLHDPAALWRVWKTSP